MAVATAVDTQSACEAAESALAEFQADATKIESLGQARQSLQWLREQYRIQPSLVQPFVERLKACSQQLLAAQRQAAQSLAEEYLRAGRMIEGWQARREVCREALMDLGRSDDLRAYRTPAGSIELKPFRALRLPEASSPHRQELMAIIEQGNLWAQTCVLNPSRLLKAIEEGRFAPQQSARVTELCPVETSYRFSTRQAE